MSGATGQVVQQGSVGQRRRLANRQSFSARPVGQPRKDDLSAIAAARDVPLTDNIAAVDANPILICHPLGPVPAEYGHAPGPALRTSGEQERRYCPICRRRKVNDRFWRRTRPADISMAKPSN
jgi:hypothetical protein